MSEERPLPPESLLDAPSDRLLGSVTVRSDLTEPTWVPDEPTAVFLATYEVKGAETLTLGVFRTEADARACCERAEARLNKDDHPGCYGRSMVSFDVEKMPLGEDFDLTGHPHFRDAP